MTDRKRRILRFIIEEYIQTAEPIGSRTISKNKGLDVSAATIRNEMSDLEDMGFLLQPHISAGRIPSQEAYLYYVTNIMDMVDIPQNQMDIITKSLSENITNLENLIDETLDLLSCMTNYIGVGVSKTNYNEGSYIVGHFDLVHLSDYNAVLLLIMQDGSVKNTLLTLSQGIDRDKLAIIAETIRQSILGQKIDAIDGEFISYIKDKICHYSSLIDDMVRAIHQGKDDNRFTFILKGATNIFDIPEFSDANFAKSFLTLLDDEKEVINLISSKGLEKEGINIIIGNQSMGDIMENCSIITADFNNGGNVIAKIGIIGPKRMDYEKIYSILGYISKKMNKSLD